MAKRATGGSPRDPAPGGRGRPPSSRGVCHLPAPGVRPAAAPGPSCAVSCPPSVVVEVWCRRGGAWRPWCRHRASPGGAVGGTPGGGQARPRESPWASRLVPSPAPPHQAGGWWPAGRSGSAGRGGGRAALARRPGATPHRASQGAKASYPMAFLRRQRGVEARRVRGHELQGAGRGQQPGGRKCPGAGAACEDTPEGVWACAGQGLGWSSARDGPGHGDGPGLWGASGSNNGLQPTPGSAVGGAQAGRGTAPRCG